MTPRTNNNRKKQPKPLAQRLKVAVIGLYAAVILVIGGTLFFMLDQKQTQNQQRGTTVVAVDDEILAVLSELEGEGSVTVPVEEIETLIPERQVPLWEQYSAVMQDEIGPKIVIVIDDLGLSMDATNRLEDMWGPYTLAYLPYARDLPLQTKRVRAAGHELMVHLPMEPKSAGADPGENALLAELSIPEFERRIEWNLSRFDGFVGVNNHMGSLLTEEAGPMVRVMMHLKSRGYLFLDSLTSPDSVGMRAAKATGVPTLSRDIFLDNIQHEDKILEQLAKVERVARRRGHAIAIGHPYPVTLDVLENWRKTLPKKGLTLVPISQVMRSKIAKEEQHASMSGMGVGE